MSKNFITLKITLDESNPPIWRKFVVRDDILLSNLHNIIQTVMGWENYHLYEFEINNNSYSEDIEDKIGMGFLDDDEYAQSKNVNKFKLSDFGFKVKDKFQYIYDMGDNWEHTLLVEKIEPEDVNQKNPKCLDGKRACPPEDCGGVWGYEETLGVINNPNDEEYEETLDWIGEDFNPELFDVKKINKNLKNFTHNKLAK